MPLKQYDSEGNYVDTIYTQAELNEAVKSAKEACAVICDNNLCGTGNPFHSRRILLCDCAKKIRARNK